MKKFNEESLKQEYGLNDIEKEIREHQMIILELKCKEMMLARMIDMKYGTNIEEGI